jgi:hypothetical protein
VKTLSVALKAHLASKNTSVATCWLVTLSNGTVKAFTDHDQALVFQGNTYLSAGYTATDVQSSSALNVDNMEVDGILESPSITEDDLAAGLWDYAQFQIFQVNWADLTQGKMFQRVGRLGEVTLNRGQFKAELRGLMQTYYRTIGELTSPSCRADLGDSRCGVSLAGFTVTGTIQGVNSDELTLYDSARTEPGPAGGVAISHITNANPGHISVAPPYLPTTVTNGTPINISGVGGMTNINVATIIRNLNNTSSGFDLGVDTSSTADYPPYTSGGIVTPLGAEASYFDGGLMTINDGANAGFSREVKVYVPGQITLQLPFPYPVEVGAAYTLVAGCDKSFATCKAKFNNALNFRGEPYIPGQDKLIQIGRK